MQIPNWIDFEPIKHIRVQISSIGGFFDIDTGEFITPFVAAISGNDNVVGPVVGNPAGPPVLMSIGNPIDNMWHLHHDWTIIPNPDWEQIRIVVPRDNTVYEIVVDTISIPEPASLVLLAIGILALPRRRR